MGRQLKFTLHIARTEIRPHPHIKDSKECHHAGTYYAVGGPKDRCIQDEGELQGLWHHLPQTGLEDEVLACGSGVQKLCRAVPLQDILYAALCATGKRRRKAIYKTVQRPQWETPSDSESKDLINGTLLVFNELKPDEPQLDQ